MSEILRRHRTANLVRTAALIAAMGAVLALVGWLLGGGIGALIAIASAALLTWLAPSARPERVLAARGARPLLPTEAPWLHEAVDRLTVSAGLDAPPRLFLVPLRGPQAFAVGEGDARAIAVSPALLRALGPREVIAVVAHEVAHLKHGDLRLLRLSESVGRATRTLSWLGLALLVLNLPLVLVGAAHVPWLAVFVLAIAPRAVGSLSLSLSRAREHDADVGAVALTGDPMALARALLRIEALSRGPWWSRLFTIELPIPEAWRTHPSTDRRVTRLRAMADAARPKAEVAPEAGSPPRRVVSPVWVRRGAPIPRGRRIVVG